MLVLWSNSCPVRQSGVFQFPYGLAIESNSFLRTMGGCATLGGNVDRLTTASCRTHEPLSELEPRKKSNCVDLVRGVT